MRRFLLVGFLGAAACGASNGDDDGATVDGGSDGATGCNAVVSFQPMMPVAPATIVARSDVFGAQGVITYTWQVRKDGVDVAFTALDSDSRDIQFDAPTAGVYSVNLFVGGGCQPFFGNLNVMQPGAMTRQVRLRLVPPTSISAPPQERVIVISGGADFAAGIVTLDAGSVFPITVRTPQAAPVPAYLRFTSRATPDAVIESFSDTAGNASVRLVAGTYDVLVVPTTASLAPLFVPNWNPLQGALTVDGGLTLGGSVLDAAGVGVGGARVVINSGGFPSTVATTAGDGSFSLRWREGAAMEKVTVVPPAAGALPLLYANVEIGTMAAITVRHATVPTSDVSNTLVRVGGTPAVSADVLVDLSRASAGTIRDGAGATVLAQATGNHRRTLRTDSNGRLPSSVFIDGMADIFITSTGPGGMANVSFPLGGTLDSVAPVTVNGRIMRNAGGVRADARVRATLTGTLAHAGAPIPSTVTGADGRFTLSLAAGAHYTFTFTDPTADDAALSVVRFQAAAEDLGDLTLPAAVSISGEVRATGQSVGARAVGVAALCDLNCTGIDRSRPLGDAVTDAAGRFVVAVPDPGVSQ